MKIYIAAPLFCDAERNFNLKVDAVLRECGHETFLPQRDAGRVDLLPETVDGLPKRIYLFKKDCEHMDWCDTVLFLMDGRVPDEGACFEIGYCYHAGKRLVGLKTDARSFTDSHDNAMLVGAVETVLHSLDELKAFFSQR